MSNLANKTIKIKIKISVIIPVFHVERYIETCIASLKAQTLHEIEFIFVDDCGSDASMCFVEAFAADDNRVRIIRNPHNLGAGPSRNAGIEKAQGEYLSFVDPDDYVSLDFYERLYNKAVEGMYDIVKSSVIALKTDGTLIPQNSFNDSIIKNHNKRPLFYLFRSQHWSAIYHKDLFCDGQVKYGSSRCSEDSLFLLIVCNKTERIGFAPMAEYYYRNRESSLSNTNDESRFFSDLDSIDEKIDYMLKNMEIDDNAYGYIGIKGHVYWMNYMRALAAHTQLERIHEEYEKRLLQALSMLPKRKNDKPLNENIYVRGLIEQGVFIYKKPSIVSKMKTTTAAIIKRLISI